MSEGCGGSSPPRDGEEAARSDDEGAAAQQPVKPKSILSATGQAIRRARELRREMSLPERMLWVRLRGRKGDERWRKQHPYGRLDLDFLNPASRLIVEVDGIAHDMGGRPARDERRDAWLRSEGSEIPRVAAVEVMRDADGVADGMHRMAAAIRAARGPSDPLRGPPPRSGEE